MQKISQEAGGNNIYLFIYFFFYFFPSKFTLNIYTKLQIKLCKITI